MEKIAIASGYGMTTLPHDPVLLGKRVKWAVESFDKTVEKPVSEYYLFVLEDTDTGEVVGTSAIESAIGFDLPFYSYHISQRTRISHALNIRTDYKVLSLVNDLQDSSEICTLFLHPDYRKNANGLLLSRARFLFMAQFPNRFADRVIAEMRGVSSPDGNSPFWDHVIGGFFKIPFKEADKLTLTSNKQYITDLMPRSPLYVQLLHPEAQAVIGQPHPSTAPAMKILFKEGFRFNNYIDIFDGGPAIEAMRTDIKTLSSSRELTIKSIKDDVVSPPYLLSNTNIDFRAVLTSVMFDQRENACIISKETAEILQLQIGDSIRLAPLHRQSPTVTKEGTYGSK
jgi:arginine N-succinyltransferase